MRPLALMVALLAAVGCRRVPPADAHSTLEVLELALAFPTPEEGALSFEVALPVNVPRVGALRWELFLGGRRFAEGAAMNPDIRTDAAGRRFLHLDAPLVFRRLGWREGGTWLDVGLRGELQPLGGDQRWPFKGRRELLVNAAPVLGETSE